MKLSEKLRKWMSVILGISQKCKREGLEFWKFLGGFCGGAATIA